MRGLLISGQKAPESLEYQWIDIPSYIYKHFAKAADAVTCTAKASLYNPTEKRDLTSTESEIFIAQDIPAW